MRCAALETKQEVKRKLWLADRATHKVSGGDDKKQPTRAESEDLWYQRSSALLLSHGCKATLLPVVEEATHRSC